MLILHLSDIHFRRSEISTAQDPNVHLRNEIVRDVVAKCNELGPPDAIVISGDIAFAAHPDEFAFATEWLASLCEACGGSLDSVFVCPGNHDVVRSQADRNMVQLVHNAIKDAADPTAEIGKQLMDPDARRLLYESLDNYNNFALQFFCDLLPPDRTLARRDLKLNDGSTLRLWGLNTSVVSSSHDIPGHLFVDPASFQITRHSGVVNLVAAHHHFSWLKQSQALEDHLNDVAPIQIFGHIHTNRIDLNVDHIRLTASAANPDRREPGWEPGYNFLRVTVDGVDEARHLKLEAHVRVWQTAPGGFIAKRYKGNDVWRHSIQLEPWKSPSVAADDVVSAAHAGTSSAEAGETPLEGGPAMSTIRDLGVRFYRLSFSKKSEIAGRLKLLEEEDMKQPDHERFRQVFIRAHERGLLNELADAVSAAEKE